MSYWDLTKALTDVPAAIRWCRDRKLLAREMACEACWRECREVKRPWYLEGVCWRFPRKGCQKLYLLRHNNYFSNSKLSLEKILRTLHMRSTKTQLCDMMKELKIASEVDLYNFCRDVCVQYCVDNPAVIGGPGLMVQIDKSKFRKSKYKRGRYVHRR